MYKTFRVQNFRCFEDLELTDLARVNLIGGANNVGKSSLLEALFLHSGDIPLNKRLRQAHLRWDSLILNFDITKVVTTTSDTHSVELAILELDDSLKSTHEYREILELIYRDPLMDDLEQVVKITHKEQDTPLFFMKRGNEVIRLPRKSSPIVKTYFLSGGSNGGGYDDYLRGFTTISKNREKNRLEHALQILDRRISNIVYLEDGLNVDVEGLNQPIPILSLGGGITSLLDIFLAINENSDGVVLIDEIENGLYYAILPDVWRAIHKAAVEFNVQIFATTHSEEMIQAAQVAFEDTPEDLHYIRLERDKHTQQIRAISLDAEDIAFFSSINAGMR